MGQEILMWVSVIAAFSYTFYSLGKIIWNTFQEQKSGCTNGCCGCSAKTDLLKNIRFKQTAIKDRTLTLIKK